MQNFNVLCYKKKNQKTDRPARCSLKMCELDLSVSIRSLQILYVSEFYSDFVHNLLKITSPIFSLLLNVALLDSSGEAVLATLGVSFVKPM